MNAGCSFKCKWQMRAASISSSNTPPGSKKYISLNVKLLLLLHLLIIAVTTHFLYCCFASLQMTSRHGKAANLESHGPTESIWLRKWSRNGRLVGWFGKRLCITFVWSLWPGKTGLRVKLGGTTDVNVWHIAELPAALMLFLLHLCFHFDLQT